MTATSTKVLMAFVNKFRAPESVSDLTEITPQSLDLEEEQFYDSLKGLEKLGYISGLQWCSNGKCLYDAINIRLDDKIS